MEEALDLSFDRLLMMMTMMIYIYIFVYLFINIEAAFFVLRRIILKPISEIDCKDKS